MTTYNELVSALLDRLAVTGAAEPEGKLAYLGFAPSSYTIKVTGAPNWVWVRLAEDDERAPSQALNLAQVRLFPDLPVRVKQQGKRLVVTGYDPTTIDEFLGNRSLSITSPTASEPDLVGPRRIKPGLVHAYKSGDAYGMTAQVESFWYVDPADLNAKLKPASLIDLTSYIPASSNNHVYVMVVFDRTDASISAISGTSKLVTIPLDDDDISSIDLAGKTPLCAVKLTNGMTALDKDYYFEDTRPWWIVGGGSTLDDHDHSGDAGDGGTFDAANLTSGAAADGQVLTADGAGGAAWEDVAGGGASQLSDLSDVNTSTPTNRNMLVADGVDWESRALEAADIQFGTLAHERGGLEADVSAYDGLVRISGGSTSQVKCNLSASAAPTANEDSGDGYSVGSRWIDTTADKEYVCLDASVGAAVWTETTQAGTGGGDSDAIHDNVVGEIAAVTEKASPVSADLLLIEDSEASNAKKRVQIGNLPGGGTLADHDHSGDAGDGGTFDAANLTSGAATDGQVLTADGAGGAAWEDVPGGGGGDATSIDGLSVTGTPADGRILRVDDAGIEFVGSSQTDTCIGYMLSSGSYDDIDSRMTALQPMSITAVQCYVYNPATYTVKIWNTTKTVVLRQSDSVVKSTTGGQLLTFTLPSAFEMLTGDYVYVELENSVNVRWYTHNNNATRNSTNGFFQLSVAGASRTDVVWVGMNLIFVAGSVSQVLNYVDYAHGARVNNNANISIPDSTVTAIPFNAEDWDDNAFHSTSSNTERLVIPETARYMVGACVEWQNNTSGRRHVEIQRSPDSGANWYPVATSEIGVGPAGEAIQALSSVIGLSAGNYVRLVVYQSSGGALNITSTSGRSPILWIQRVK